MSMYGRLAQLDQARLVSDPRIEKVIDDGRLALVAALRKTVENLERLEFTPDQAAEASRAVAEADFIRSIIISMRGAN